MFLNRDEREMISSSISFLNSVIRQASLAAGVEFIDIEHSLDGHRLCDNGEDYENAAIWRIGTLGFSDYGSFHPNSKGQQAIGNTIWSSLVESGSCITNLSNCSNDFDISVDPSATEDTIDIPAYFQNIEWRNSFYKNLTSFDQIINGTVDISVGSYTFASGTIATITGHSNPVNLGEYITASDGSLHATLRLPLSMDIGFHRIIVSGTSYTGVPVEYEQIIYIGGGEEDNAAAEDEHLAHMLSESRPGEPDARFKSPIPALYFRNSDLINHGSPRKAGDTTIKSDFSLHLLIGIITVAAYITLSVMKKLVNKRS